MGLFRRYANRPPPSMPISRELPQYEKYCTQVINLRRRMRHVKKGSFPDHKHTISMYLGWAQQYGGVPDARLSLRLFGNQGLWLRFISHMVGRSKCPQAKTNVICQSIRVAKYLQEADTEVEQDGRKVRHGGGGAAWVPVIVVGGRGGRLLRQGSCPVLTQGCNRAAVAAGIHAFLNTLCGRALNSAHALARSASCSAQRHDLTATYACAPSCCCRAITCKK